MEPNSAARTQPKSDRITEDSAKADWVKEFPGTITVCDRDGVILEMNDRAARIFAGSGGRALIGTNALDCHPEPARTKLETLLATQETNAYTIEKAGVHKLIFQSPWFVDGVCRGLIELALEIPAKMPHFVRDPDHPV